MLPEKFYLDDLVWAKMRNYPYWPARIVKSPPTASPRRAQHYVYFFGSRNHAWISDNLILPHSEQMIRSCKKNKSATFSRAVDEIISENESVGRKDHSILKTKVSKSNQYLSKIITPKQKKNKKKSKAMRKRPSTESKDGSLPSPDEKLKLNIEAFSGIKSKDSPNCHVAVIGTYNDETISESLRYLQLPITPRLDTKKEKEHPRIAHVKPTTKRIGFLGLGMMGQGIVKNLLKSGHHVTVWNRTPDKCDEFVRNGALRGQTPAGVVQASDIIFCCVLDLDAAKTVVFGSDGVLVGLENSDVGRKGYVEMTSIDDQSSHEIAEAILIKGGKYLEAPITGSKQLSEDGALLLLASGDRELFNSCETCFHAISKHAFFVSCEIGNGSKFSLVLSTFMGTLYAGLAEALALAERIKISQVACLEILHLSGYAPPLLVEKGNCILKREFIANTPLGHQQKDMTLALQLSDRCQQPMPVTSAANELFKHARLLGYAEHDVCAVYHGSKR